jgi:hypothetical protein
VTYLNVLLHLTHTQLHVETLKLFFFELNKKFITGFFLLLLFSYSGYLYNVALDVLTIQVSIES